MYLLYIVVFINNHRGNINIIHNTYFYEYLVSLSKGQYKVYDSSYLVI